MVETLVKHMKTSRGGCPPLIDYAYGGAIIDNTIGTAKPVPAGADQVKMYLSDIKSKAIKRSKGRVLHVNFNGIKYDQLLRSLYIKLICRSAPLLRSGSIGKAMGTRPQRLAQ